MTPPIRAWTDEEFAYLTRYASTKTLRVMSQELGRTESSVERKLRSNKLRCTNVKPRSEWLAPERHEMTPEAMERASQLHLKDLRQAGHTWWHRFPAAEADVLPSRVLSTFSLASCTGSPAAMCFEG